MSFFFNKFQALKTYVNDFEKSIDADFANRTKDINKENEKNQNESIETTKNEDDKIENKENDKNEKEEITIIDNDNNDFNNDNNDFDNDNNNFDNDNNDNGLSDEEKANILKSKIEKIETELEEQNKLFEEHQKILEALGPNSNLLNLEFERRSASISNQINEMKKMEDSLNKEISEFLSDSHNDLNNLQANYSNVKKNLEEAQNKYNGIINDSKALLDEDQQLTIDIDKTIDMINKSKQNISNIKLEISKTANEKEILSSRIKKDQDIITKLCAENSEAENELQKANSKRQEYVEKINQNRERVTNLKQKIQDAYFESEKNIQEQRRMKAQSMKNYTSSLLETMEREKNELITQLQNNSNNQIQQEEKNDNEIRDIKNMISDAEIESISLNQKFNDTKISIPKLVEPIEMQIDSFKSSYNANELIEKSVIDRLMKSLAEIEAKKESVDSSYHFLRAEFNKLIQEKASLNSESSSAKSQELNKSIEVVTKEIEELRNILFDSKSKVHSLQADISIKNSKLQQISGQIKNLEVNYNNQINTLNNQLQHFEKQINSAASPSLFSQWKKLAKECGDIENEIQMKLETIKKQKDLEIVFNQTLEILAERQESVDQVKRAIHRDREFFKKKVTELIG